jgi:hypothetical protein
VIVPIARQPNIKTGIQDQTNTTLNLFNTILDTANMRAQQLNEILVLKNGWNLDVDKIEISSNLLVSLVLDFL